MISTVTDTVTAPKIVSYIRVSTKKQGISGLGLEAQQRTIQDYAIKEGAEIIAEFKEVESGKKSLRPELTKAIALARSRKATLVIAKLDRLSRNMALTAALMDSGVEFVACDNPHANRLTLHILAAVAEDESKRISQRIVDALKAAKARGVKLGSARPGHWKGREHLWGYKKAAKVSAQVRRQEARKDYAYLMSVILDLRQRGGSYQDVANELNRQGYVTRNGVAFRATTIFRILEREDGRMVQREAV